MPASGQDGGDAAPGANAGSGADVDTPPASGGGDAVETQPLAGETTFVMGDQIGATAGPGLSLGATFAGTVAGSLASTLVGTVDLGSPVISAVVGGAVSGAVNTVVTQLVETGVMASAGSVASGALSGAGQGLISLGVGALTQGIDDPVISTVVNHVATNFVSNAITGAANPFSAQGLLGADFGGSMLGGLLAKVVMPNGDPLGMSIGGMVGSAGAIALAGGMTALTAMGFVGAFLVPFAGAFLGALLGGAIGSIFGGNDAHVGMGSSGVYAADGSVTGYGVGGKRVKDYTPLWQWKDRFAAIGATLVDTYGVNLAGERVLANYEYSEGYNSINIREDSYGNPDAIFFNHSDPNSIPDAVLGGRGRPNPARTPMRNRRRMSRARRFALAA